MYSSKKMCVIKGVLDNGADDDGWINRGRRATERWFPSSKHLGLCAEYTHTHTHKAKQKRRETEVGNGPGVRVVRHSRGRRRIAHEQLRAVAGAASGDVELPRIARQRKETWKGKKKNKKKEGIEQKNGPGGGLGKARLG